MKTNNSVSPIWADCWETLAGVAKRNQTRRERQGHFVIFLFGSHPLLAEQSFVTAKSGKRQGCLTAAVSGGPTLSRKAEAQQRRGTRRLRRAHRVLAQTLGRRDDQTLQGRVAIFFWQLFCNSRRFFLLEEVKTNLFRHTKTRKWTPMLESRERWRVVSTKRHSFDQLPDALLSPYSELRGCNFFLVLLLGCEPKSSNSVWFERLTKENPRMTTDVKLAGSSTPSGAQPTGKSLVWKPEPY